MPGLISLRVLGGADPRSGGERAGDGRADTAQRESEQACAGGKGIALNGNENGITA